MTASLKRQAFISAGYILAGQGAGHLIRLASSLVLTRLLAPEMFGLMAIINVLITALALLSDIGTTPNIVRSPRGFEPEFLNTAWTLQVLRGIGLWASTMLVANPVALFYGQSDLTKLIPVAGLTLFISGFNSMALPTMSKKMQVGKVVVMNSVTGLIGTIFLIVCAYFFRNIWAMIAGNLFSSLLKLGWSYTLDRSLCHRFIIDRSACLELFSFGKWIFFSTAMMFAATQTDRILLGKFLSITLFGIYNLAATLSELPKMMVSAISAGIIFPLMAMHRDLPRRELMTKVLRRRKWLLILLALLVALLSGFGDVLILLLYDARYQEAGWMLPVLALGMWPLVLYTTLDRILYVFDLPKYSAFGNLGKFIYMLTLFPVIFLVAGKFGAVVAVALNDLPVYAVVNYGLKQHNLSGMRQDAWATALLLLMLTTILLIRHLAGMGFPGQAAFISSL